MDPRIEAQVIEHALQRGMLDSAQLARARGELAGIHAEGQSPSLLTHLRDRYLAPAAVAEKALRLIPSNALAWIGRGSVKANLGQRTGAIADFREGLRRLPKASPQRPPIEAQLKRLLGAK